MPTREQLHKLIEELPEAHFDSVAENLQALRDPETERPDDVVDEWGNLSALRRATAGTGGRFSGMLGRLSQAEIAQSGETLGESMMRTKRETSGEAITRTGHETITRAKTRAKAMERGQVWWYEHPDFKPRPAAILSPEEAIESTEEIYAVFATTTIRDLSTEIALGADEGMPTACVLAADQIDVADKLSLTSQIVTLGDEKMTELAKALDPIPSEGLILKP
jgi:mRNA-degrading endonuclease toxin of MazEF toxin-antitoxin module